MKSRWWADVCDAFPGSPDVFTYRDRSGAVAFLVVFDPNFQASTGGMQLRYADETLVSLSHGAQFTLESAGCGSIKCWLNSLPICGGKLVVIAPESMRCQADEQLALFERVGRDFAGKRYWAKPDVGTGHVSDLLSAYQCGGGQVTASIAHLPALGDRTAYSVVGGMIRVLQQRHQTDISDATVVLLAANGRLGQKMLARFHAHKPRKLYIAAFHGELSELAQRFDAEVLDYRQALVQECDILCTGGPPRHLGEREVRRMNAKVVGGPGNDWLARPELYSLRDSELDLLPGALLTSASMYDPRVALEDVDEPHEIEALSARIMDSVIGQIGHNGANEFEVMVYTAMANRQAIDC